MEQNGPATAESAHIEESHYLFRRFLTQDRVRKGLQLQFEVPDVELLRNQWLALDLETVERRASEASRVSLDIDDEYFDMVFCTGLDRVARPASLIAEIRRVLKPRGQVWAQAPFSRDPQNQKATDTDPAYWHFTPKGFQILFEHFDKIRCSLHPITGSKTQKDIYFYGLKPEISSEMPKDRAHLARSMRPL